jgi:hypothetical protein
VTVGPLAGLEGVRFWVRAVSGTSVFTTLIGGLAVLLEELGWRLRFRREFGHWPYGRWPHGPN